LYPLDIVPPLWYCGINYNPIGGEKLDTFYHMLGAKSDGSAIEFFIDIVDRLDRRRNLDRNGWACEDSVASACEAWSLNPVTEGYTLVRVTRTDKTEWADAPDDLMKGYVPCA